MRGGKRETSSSTARLVIMREKTKIKKHIPVTIKHCCYSMDTSIDDERVPITYIKIFREYAISIFYDHATIRINYCPWCTKKLPSSLKDRYFLTLHSKHNIQTSMENLEKDFSDLPHEFKSDRWWKRRKISMSSC